MPSKKETVLAVDDDKDVLDTYRSVLKSDYSVIGIDDPSKVIPQIERSNVDVVLLDIKMPKVSGLEVLRSIKARDPRIEVIMITALKDLKNAVSSMKEGAYDYLNKPFDVEELKNIIEKAIEKRSLIRQNEAFKDIVEGSFGEIIGRSEEILSVLKTVEKVAPSDSSVLITGETGCGKELIAKAIHKKSKRAGMPMVAVNCAAIPENLFESELFGFEKGSFTGAFESKPGKFELADGGTLFLDEVGCLPLPSQSKLLRVIQDGKIERIGGVKPIPADIRLICATNSDLKTAVANRSFREDLFYRLNVIPLAIPPLRSRKDDIKYLVQYFLSKLNKKCGKKIMTMNAGILKRFSAYDWPGNIRELENIMERLVILSSGNNLDENDLPNEFFHKEEYIRVPLKEALENYEIDCLKKALRSASGNQTKAADLLKIDRTTLLSKMRKYNCQ